MSLQKPQILYHDLALSSLSQGNSIHVQCTWANPFTHNTLKLSVTLLRCCRRQWEVTLMMIHYNYVRIKNSILRLPKYNLDRKHCHSHNTDTIQCPTPLTADNGSSTVTSSCIDLTGVCNMVLSCSAPAWASLADSLFPHTTTSLEVVWSTSQRTWDEKSGTVISGVIKRYWWCTFIKVYHLCLGPGLCDRKLWLWNLSSER